MRRRSVLAITALCAASPSFAADITATSKIDAVTVFPAGAEISRTAKVKLPAGEHVVIFPDLPRDALANSIRVEGKSTGRIEIGSVDSRSLNVPRTDAASTATERRRVEAEIETLKDAKTVLAAQVQTAETQKSLITNLTNLPTRPAPTVGTAPAENWSQILTLIGTSLADVHKTIIETQLKLRDIDRKIADLQKKLTETAPVQDQRTEVKVFVNAGAGADADLVVRYQVASAGWQPLYDARLTTGTKAIAAKLQLTRRASITQRTQEAWDGVAMTLSTARPSAGTVTAELNPTTVDFAPEKPPTPVGGAAPAAPVTRGMVDKLDEKNAPEISVDQEKTRSRLTIAPAVQQTAQAEASPFQVLYSLTGPQTIPNSGETKRVVIDQTELDPTLSVRATPKIEPKAYLYAKLTLPKAAPYLPGQVSLFRDSTFVGMGRLPALTPGQEFDLGFGPDDAVRIRYANIDEKRSESGIISSSRNDARNFRIIMTNKHDRPIAITVFDQLPVSNNQEIKVEMTAKPQPTKRDLDDKRGVLSWEDTLKPDEEKTIEFGYKVTWPAQKNITYGR
jgi:uncharacterized protein (TIGR02231 family)